MSHDLELTADVLGMQLVVEDTPDHLDGDLLTRLAVHTLVDATVSTLSETFRDFVLLADFFEVSLVVLGLVLHFI